MSAGGDWEQITAGEIGVGAPVIVTLGDGEQALGTVEAVILPAPQLGTRPMVHVRLDTGSLWSGKDTLVRRQP